MTVVHVSITRFVSLDPQPGIVEFTLTDARGRTCVFQDKTALFSSEDLDPFSIYPRPDVIACEVLSQGSDKSGRITMVIDTTRPWGVESTEGQTIFEVLADQVLESPE
jgi:hypothetical protein